MNVSVRPSVDSVALPAIAVVPFLTDIDHPVASGAEKVIDGLVAVETPVAPGAGVCAVTAITGVSATNTTSTK